MQDLDSIEGRTSLENYASFRALAEGKSHSTDKPLPPQPSMSAKAVEALKRKYEENNG